MKFEILPGPRQHDDSQDAHINTTPENIYGPPGNNKIALVGYPKQDILKSGSNR